MAESHLAGLVVASLTGVGAGLVLTSVLLRRSAAARARDRFAAWCATAGVAVRRSALEKARGGIKEAVGRDLLTAAKRYSP